MLIFFGKNHYIFKKTKALLIVLLQYKNNLSVVNILRKPTDKEIELYFEVLATFDLSLSRTKIGRPT